MRRTEIDSARLTDQAEGATQLWPVAEAPSGGAGTTLQFVRSAAPEKRPGSATDA